VVSPHLAFIARVHVGTQITLEVVAELFLIGEGTDDPEVVGCMFVGQDQIFEYFRSILGAPHISGAQPEQLIRCIVLEPGQPRFGVQLYAGPRIVCIIRLLDATIVCDVLTLCVISVYLQKISR